MSMRDCVTATAARAGEMDTVMAAGLTVSFNVTLCVTALALESLTVNVIGVAAALAVGVPEMTPVEARMRPPGSAPAVMPQDSGPVPPVAVSAAE